MSRAVGSSRSGSARLRNRSFAPDLPSSHRARHDHPPNVANVSPPHFGRGNASSEIRLVGSRQADIISGDEITRGIGADHFRPLAQRAQWASIADGRRPWLGENALILDGEFELQPLATIVEVACKARIGTRNAAKLSLAAFFRRFRGLVIEQPITLHYVKSLAVRRPIHVD